MRWKRYRFGTYATDWRPLVCNPQYPFWNSGESNNTNGEYSIIIAYLPADEELLKYWDDAFDIKFTEEEKINFTPRFPRPENYVES